MILFLLAGLLHPLPQTDWDFYRWCLDNTGEGEAYCCTQAGGIEHSGLCVDQTTGHVPWNCPDHYNICIPPEGSEWWPK